MIEPKVYKDEVLFTLQDVENRQDPDRVLLCSPDYFDIVDEKNVHMQGNIGVTDKVKVMQEWTALKEIYDGLKEHNILKEVAVLSGAQGCEDMVFCANQTLPYRKQDGEYVVVMSHMRHESRRREVPYFETFFASKGFTPLHFTGDVLFEGMGDVIPHPGKKLLYGGYGHRTSIDAYHELSTMLDTPVVALELVSPRFYHLDTCFVPLSGDSVMLCKEAFTEAGLRVISKLFSKVYYIPGDEAEAYFSLNAHAFRLNGHSIAILQPGSTVTKQVLLDEGFEVIETETGEFMKSGGSVFCMKMMY
jgi:N-dimethylarginine dimethylaminohydrolase